MRDFELPLNSVFFPDLKFLYPLSISQGNPPRWLKNHQPLEATQQLLHTTVLFIHPAAALWPLAQKHQGHSRPWPPHLLCPLPATHLWLVCRGGFFLSFGSQLKNHLLSEEILGLLIYYYSSLLMSATSYHRALSYIFIILPSAANELTHLFPYMQSVLPPH